ncbi:MAG: GMP/IMP nucleotidase [Thioalkalispiraceae bacterium]|jgi:putative hydrolase of the HAD superfamily
MVDWQEIDTVLLDMDGTLLDLYFDNYFWREHVPTRYAEKHELSVDDAKRTLYPIFRNKEGTMDWYCVDYWTRTLEMDIAQLKAEVDHLIAIHPYVIEFLDRLRRHNKAVALVTNAHQKSLMLKMDRTSLHNHIENIICAHDFGMPKENPDFWDRLHERITYDKERTLLIDDSLSVLRSAKTYGIANLLAVYHPDSRDQRRNVEEFDAIEDFDQIMPD